MVITFATQIQRDNFIDLFNKFITNSKSNSDAIFCALLGTQWKQVVKKNDPRDKLLIPFDVKILIKKCLVSNSSALAKYKSFND